MRREGFVVKVRSKASEVPAGVGFMVGPNQLVTCAHVVNVALGRTKEDRTKPSDRARIQVEFVLLGDAEEGRSGTVASTPGIHRRAADRPAGTSPASRSWAVTWFPSERVRPGCSTRGSGTRVEAK